MSAGERNERLIALISQNKQDIESIIQAGEEYYFLFRDKAFSVVGGGGDYALFAYPKWRDGIQDLVREMEIGAQDPDAAFVGLSTDRTKSVTGELYGWLRSKDIGLDELFSDLGVV